MELKGERRYIKEKNKKKEQTNTHIHTHTHTLNCIPQFSQQSDQIASPPLGSHGRPQPQPQPHPSQPTNCFLSRTSQRASCPSGALATGLLQVQALPNRLPAMQPRKGQQAEGGQGQGRGQGRPRPAGRRLGSLHFPVCGRAPGQPATLTGPTTQRKRTN